MRSKQAKKQRRYRANAPLHTRQKFMHARLTEDLREKYGKKSVQVAKGDTVRVMRGDNKGHEGVVQSADLKRGKITVEGVVVAKADMSEVPQPIDPSNVMITKLNLEDMLREESISRK